MRTRTTAVAAASSCRHPGILPSVESLDARRLLSTTVTISTNRAQTIDGFGTSLGGTTALSLIKTTKFQKAYYQDLGASVFRVALNPWILQGKTKSGKKSIGVAVDMGPSLLKNVAKFDFNNSNIQKYGMMAKAAKKYGSHVSVIGSFWSPPYWMKGEEINSTTGQGNGTQPTFDDKTGNTAGGSLKDNDANLTQFARYVAAYVKGFEKAFGVALDGISIQNELAFHEFYSSAVYDPKLYVKALKAVDRWFTKYGITTKIIGPEDVGVGSTSDTGILNRQMAYVKAVRADPDAMKAIDVYAIHGYADDGVTDQRSPEMWGRYWNGQDGKYSYSTFSGIRVDHKHSWMTETSGFGSTWNATLRLASNMQDALVYGNVSAFVYWGITKPVDDGETLMAGADYKAGKYSAFKHFSKYVRPGAVRLQTSKTDPTGVYVSAYADDANKALTSVAINNTTDAQTVTLKLDGIGLKRFGTAYVSTEGKTWRAMDSMRVSGGKVTFKMPARSIMTLVGSTGKTAAATGSISGVYFLDANKNGKQDAAEKGFDSSRVFLDTDADGVRDPKEPVAVTDKSGKFAFTGLPAGTYRVRPIPAAGWVTTTPPSTTKLKKGSLDVAGVSIGAAKKSSTPTTPTNPTNPTRTASIAGHAFADTNGDGRQTGTEPDAAGKVVFLDRDNDGALDGGETKTTTDADGDFTFAGLAAGTYYVRRVYSTGFTASVPASPVTLTNGQHKTGVLIGSKPR